MQFRYTIWQKTRDGHVEPMPEWTPAGLTSSEMAREDARTHVLKHGIPAVFLEVESHDRSVVEEWHWWRGKWVAEPHG